MALVNDENKAYHHCLKKVRRVVFMVRMRKDTDQKISEYGHFSRSAHFFRSISSHNFFIIIIRTSLSHTIFTCQNYLIGRVKYSLSFFKKS